MSVTTGASIPTSGLILHLDPRSPKNYKLSPLNLFGNGSFVNGLGIPQELGSQPQNDIIQMPNPGDSDYILRQAGNFTEYQLNLGAELTANTAYVMSCWYAKSADYNGANTLFHNRAYSASGTHVSVGSTARNILFTKVVNGITWEYCYQSFTTPADYSNNFNWYVGYGQASPHNGYRYYANICMEKGTFPSIVDLSGSGNHHFFEGVPSYNSNGYFAFDGSTSKIWRPTSLTGQSTNCTVIIVYSTTDTQELWVRGNQDNGTYLSASASNNYYHGNVGTPTNYVDLNVTVRPDTPINYRDGNFHMFEAKNVNFSTWNYYEWFGYPGGWPLLGNVACILVYNRSITASESAQIYYALRGRHNF